MACATLCRRLFETYAKLTGGKARADGVVRLRRRWEYMNVMRSRRRKQDARPDRGRGGIEGKDIGTGFSSSYFPATFGLFRASTAVWSLYYAENLAAKAVGWDATYPLS